MSAVRVDVENGKYSVVINYDMQPTLVALRHGEPWPARDLAGDKLVFSLAHELHEARDAHLNQSARLVAAEALAAAYKAQRDELMGFVDGAPVASGVCCCGDNMVNHADPMISGHSAVDMWDYSLSSFREQFKKFDQEQTK